METLTSLFRLEDANGGFGKQEAHDAASSELKLLVVQCKDELQSMMQERLQLQETLLRSLHATVDELCYLPRTGGYATEIATASSAPVFGGEQGSLSTRSSVVKESIDMGASSRRPSAWGRSSGHSSDSDGQSAQTELNNIVNRANDALKELDLEVSANSASEELSTAGGSRWRRRRLNLSQPTQVSLIDNITTAVIQLRHLVTRWHLMPVLQFLSLVIVIVDATVIALETDQMARHGKDYSLDNTLVTIGWFIVSWYIIELALRVLLQRPIIKFFTGRDWRWNVFDFSLTTMSVCDLVLRDMSIRLRTLAILRLLRVIRILRLLRMVRVFRVMAFLREFHKLVLCLACSAQTLFPAMVLMCFFIFCVGILFTQSVANYLQETEHVDPVVRQELEQGFGTVSLSMLSLYMAITSGKNWGDQYELLQNVGAMQSFMFFVFLMVAIYGLTNVVTAVFVESAMQATQNYRELLVQEMLIKERVNVKHMKQIFSSMDLDGSGLITLEEMMRSMHDESLQLQEYFEALGLSASDYITLFNLLDSDHSGAIDIDEFCEGCMRLGGNATNFDMNCMWHEQRRTNREILKFIQHACLGLHALSKSHRTEAKDLSQVADRVQHMLDQTHASHYAVHSGGMPLPPQRSVMSSPFLTASSCPLSAAAREESDKVMHLRDYFEHSLDVGPVAAAKDSKVDLTDCIANSRFATGQSGKVTETCTTAATLSSLHPSSSCLQLAQETPSRCSRDDHRHRESL